MRMWIILAFLLVSLLPFPFLARIAFNAYEKKISDTYMSVMQGEGHLLADKLSSGYFWNKQSEEMKGLIDQYANIYHARTVVIDPSLRILHDSYGTDTDHIMIEKSILRALDGVESHKYNKSDHSVETVIPIYGSDQKTINAALWTRCSVSFYDMIQKDTRDFIVMVLIAVCVALVILAYLFALSIVHPIRKLGRQMDEAAHGLRDQEIKVSTFNETNDIAYAFNLLKNRYEVVDNSRKEFVANVSHELKTPITSMKVLAESLIQMPDAPSELYQEFMHDIVSQLDRETAIIDDLLALVKLDRRTGTLHLSDVNINEMLERLIKQLGPLAHVKDVSVTFESHRNVTARVDEVKLSLACMNVIENAIKYNRESGSIKISLDIEEDYCVITCSDTGLGIPQEDIDKVFERFYRVDKSHSQQMGGSGLGLAIVRQAVEMQDGTVSIDSTEGVGTVVTIKVPLVVVAGSEEGGQM